MTTVNRSNEWFGSKINAGEEFSGSIIISESYAGADITIPVHVCRGKKEGPTVCITGAIHGDEINGTGTIRHIIRDDPFNLIAGTLVLVPVVNIFGFERHSRYLPDRRDLNRSFPGIEHGSLAGRLAWSIFEQVTRRCDFGIDLHTAAVRRTNFPNIRADLTDARIASFARVFGTELIVNGKGPKGSLRNSASNIGCATILLEAGEVWKVEPSIVEYSIRGIENCLQSLKMVHGSPTEPEYRIETDTTKWIRAQHGGFLEYHISPGTIIAKDEPIATNTSLLGDEQNVIYAPRDGIVLGMTTLPSVAPGDPICHLAYPKKGVLRKVKKIVNALDDDSLHERVRDDLSRSVVITESDATS